MSIQNQQKQNWKMALVMALAMMVLSPYASADELGSSLCSFVNLLTGKWLFAFTILATIGGGAAMIFGAEMSEFFKKVASIVTVVGFIVGFSQLLSMAFTKFQGQAC